MDMLLNRNENSNLAITIVNILESNEGCYKRAILSIKYGIRKNSSNNSNDNFKYHL